MNWQDFFSFTVIKAVRNKEEVFFEAKLETPDHFAMQELMISRFDHLKLSTVEKKKLSLNLRKIILCHDLFKGEAFKKQTRELGKRILQSSETELSFKTQGGGIYLFINLLKEKGLEHKKIICYTSELPLPIMDMASHPHIQFIYSPEKESYLSDFSSLWKESELLELFELKDFKAAA